LFFIIYRLFFRELTVFDDDYPTADVTYVSKYMTLHDPHSSPNVIRVTRWGHVARIGEKRRAYSVSVRKPETAWKT
jgi:hypothetical protein